MMKYFYYNPYHFLSASSFALATSQNTLITSLANNNQFPYTLNGVSRIASNRFLGNQYVPSSLVAQSKVSFAAKASNLRWIKIGGSTLGGLGVVLSFSQFLSSKNSSERFIYGLDIGMGIVGFWTPLGAAASLNYSLSRGIYPFILREQTERAERLKCGDKSMQWNTWGRGIR